MTNTGGATKLGSIPMPELPASYVRVIVAYSRPRAERIASDLGFPGYPGRRVEPRGLLLVTSMEQAQACRGAEYRPCEVFIDDFWMSDAELSVEGFGQVCAMVRSRVRLPRSGR